MFLCSASLVVSCFLLNNMFLVVQKRTKSYGYWSQLLKSVIKSTPHNQIVCLSGFMQSYCQRVLCLCTKTCLDRIQKLPYPEHSVCVCGSLSLIPPRNDFYQLSEMWITHNNTDAISPGLCISDWKITHTWRTHCFLYHGEMM